MDRDASKTKSALGEGHTFPAVGARPITEVTAPDLLALRRAIESRGIVDYGASHLAALWRYFSLCSINRTSNKRFSAKPERCAIYCQAGALCPLIDPTEYAQLLRDIDDYQGEATTKRHANAGAKLSANKGGSLRGMVVV